MVLFKRIALESRVGGAKAGAACVLCASVVLFAANVPAQQLAAARIAGLVTDKNGSILPGATVTVHRAGEGTFKRTQTGANGRFAIEDLPADSYVVDIDVAEFDVFRRNHVVISRATATLDLSTTLYVSALCECTEFPVLRNPLIVSGTVADEAGRPVPHAFLSVSQGGWAYSGLDGEYVVALRAGTACTLTAEDGGFAKASRAFTVDGANAAQRALVLSPRPLVGAPDVETIRRGCRCGGDLFRHRGR